MAHQLFITLNKTNQQLRIFKKMEDILFDEKEGVRESIISLERLLNKDEKEYMKTYYLKKLTEKKEKLYQLNSLENKPTTIENGFIFDETLNKLTAREIKTFKLMLNRKKDLYIDFNLKNKTTFKIKIPINPGNEFLLSDYTIEYFKTLRFQKLNNILVLLSPNKNVEA